MEERPDKNEVMATPTVTLGQYEVFSKSRKASQANLEVSRTVDDVNFTTQNLKEKSSEHRLRSPPRK